MNSGLRCTWILIKALPATNTGPDSHFPPWISKDSQEGSGISYPLILTLINCDRCGRKSFVPPCQGRVTGRDCNGTDALVMKSEVVLAPSRLWYPGQSQLCVRTD